MTFFYDLFESSFGDGCYEGKKKGKVEGVIRGEEKATKQMVFNMVKKERTIYSNYC